MKIFEKAPSDYQSRDWNWKRKAGPSQKTPLSGKPFVLIADDELHVREDLISILETFGCTTQTAENGEEAIQRAIERRPNLIILDLIMPVMDGYETYHLIRQNWKLKSVPIIFLTEWKKDDDCVRSSSEFVAVDFLEKPFHPAEVVARCKSLLHLQKFEDDLESAEQVVRSLALAVEARDSTTGNHCDRLFFRLAKLADRLSLGSEYKDAFLKGAMLHDIGKVGVPDRILLKQGPLTDTEWEIMKRHVIIGEQLCRPLKTLRGALPIIRHHHEHYDGSGYPDGLKGEEIPISARVFQICDVFDALTNARPYKPPFSIDESIRILEQETKRGWWDPAIVRAFVEMVQD